MKKLIGRMGAYTLFGMGHIVGKTLRVTPWLYTVYNTLMDLSIRTQDWAGLDAPWSKPQTETYQDEPFKN
jgi:hypothetical protein